jgi:hypothetical protein
VREDESSPLYKLLRKILKTINKYNMQLSWVASVPDLAVHINNYNNVRPNGIMLAALFCITTGKL